MKDDKLAAVVLAAMGSVASGGVFASMGASPGICAAAAVCGALGAMAGLVEIPLFVFLWCLIGGSGPIDDWSWVSAGGLSAIGVRVAEKMRGNWGGLWFSVVAGGVGLLGCVVLWPLTRQDGMIFDLARRFACVGVGTGAGIMFFEGLKQYLYRSARETVLKEDDGVAIDERDEEPSEQRRDRAESGGEPRPHIDQKSDENIDEDRSFHPYGRSGNVVSYADREIVPAAPAEEKRNESLSIAEHWKREAEKYAAAANTPANDDDDVVDDDSENAEVAEESSDEEDMDFEKMGVEVVGGDEMNDEWRERMEVLVARLCGQAAEARDTGALNDWVMFSYMVLREREKFENYAFLDEPDSNVKCILEVLNRAIEDETAEDIGMFLKNSESPEVHHMEDEAEDEQASEVEAEPVNEPAFGSLEDEAETVFAPVMTPSPVAAPSPVMAVAYPASSRWTDFAEKLGKFINAPLIDAAEEARWFEGHTLGSLEDRRIERSDRLIANRLTLCDGSRERVDRVVRGLVDLAGFSDQGLEDGLVHALRRFVTTLTVESVSAPDGVMHDIAPVSVLGARLALCIMRDETVAAVTRVSQLIKIEEPEKEDEAEGADLKAFVAFAEREADWKFPGFSNWMSDAYAKFALERAPVTHDADDDAEIMEYRRKLGESAALLMGRPEAEQAMFHQLVDLAIGCDAIDGRISAVTTIGQDRSLNENYAALMLTRRVALNIDEALATRFRDPVNIARIVDGLNPRAAKAVDRVRSAREKVLDWRSDGEIARIEVNELRERLALAEQEAIQANAANQREIEAAKKALGVSVTARGATLLRAAMPELYLTENSATACALHYSPAGKTFGIGFIDGMGEDWVIRMVEGGEVELVCEKIEATYKLLRIAQRMVVAHPFRSGTRPVARICLINAGPKTLLTAASGFIYRLEGLLADDYSRHEMLESNSSFDEKIAASSGFAADGRAMAD